MKKLAAIFLFSLIMVANTTTASAQRVVFRGTFVITKLNQPCKDVGWFLGDLAASQFHPGGIGDNVGGNLFTGLSYYFQFFAEAYSFGGPYTDLIQGDFIDAFGAGAGRGAFSFNSKWKLTNLKPKTLTPTTNFVRMVGQIKDFDSTPGCNISFRGSYNRRIN